ncbi:MAG: hypothetical protein GY696_07590, partial [Gammaproteobacteria bacterium]|nr:hypothetical protein [Gammaproteobacteria bacterium]
METQRGGAFFSDDMGYRYHFDRDGKDGLFSIHRCAKRRALGCLARVHVQEGTVIKTIWEHNHEADAAESECIRLRTQLKRRAPEDRAPKAIMGEVLASASDPCLGKLPCRANLSRVMRAQRRKSTGYPPEPDSANFDIPEKFCSLPSGDNFLLFDSMETDPGRLRILAFGTPTMLELLATSEEWFMDGTFSACPSQFYQL